jgi:hypothetical protein
MTQSSLAAIEAARLLWARTAGDISEPEAVAEAAERMCSQLGAGLGRWVGTTGYRALLDRAVKLVRSEHPALESLACQGGEAPLIAAAAREHGAAEVAAGMMALVEALVELLGRIIGQEMALRLVEQSGSERKTGREKPSPRGIVSMESKGGRNGRVR